MYELIVASLLFYDKASVMDFVLKEEMFLDKNIYRYVVELQNGVSSGISQYELSQKYVSKQPDLKFYDLDFINKQLESFSVDTLFEIFYTKAIDNVWNVFKSNKNISTTRLEDIYQTVEDIKQIITTIENNKVVKNPFEEYRKQMELLKEQKNNGEFENGIIGYSTGISCLDQITGGLKGGDYIIIGGRPSIGKTSLALDIGIENVKRGKNVFVLSLEMTAQQLIARAIPKINSTLTLEHSVYGENINERLNDLFEANAFLERSGFEIEDFSENVTVTSLDLQKAIQKYFNKHNFYPDIVIIDYLQKINSIQKNRSENEILTEISNVIQRLGKTTGSTFIALSQLNRSLEERTDKRPMNSDLRNSGALEQDADIIMFVYREAIYLIKSLKEKLKKNNESQEIAEAIRFLEEATVDAGEIIVTKNRSGKIGTAVVDFHKTTASYMENADFLEDVIEM